MNDEKIDKFIKSIEKEWLWRSKELFLLKQVLRSADTYQQETLARAGVLLLYAHWEGFIKESSKVFLRCFANERLEQVPGCVLAAHIVKMSDRFEKTCSKYEYAFEIISCVSEGCVVCASIEEAVRTESNLTYKVLKGISRLVGVDISKFETRKPFIDQELVSIRHKIAHGEGMPVTYDDFLYLEKDVQDLIDIYKQNLISSAVNAGSFVKNGVFHTCLNIK